MAESQRTSSSGSTWASSAPGCGKAAQGKQQRQHRERHGRLSLQAGIQNTAALYRQHCKHKKAAAAAPTLALAFSGSLSAARTMSAHRLAYLQEGENVALVALCSWCQLVRKAEQAARGSGTAAAQRRAAAEVLT